MIMQYVVTTHDKEQFLLTGSSPDVDAQIIDGGNVVWHYFDSEAIKRPHAYRLLMLDEIKSVVAYPNGTYV